MKTESLLVGFISIILLYICYTDIRNRRISNVSSLSICLLSLVLGCFRPHGPAFLFPALLVLSGFIFSMVGIIGGGDVKLISALAIGFSQCETGAFLMYTCLSGIPLSVIALIYYKVFKTSGKKTVPYGVAITVGYWLQWFV